MKLWSVPIIPIAAAIPIPYTSTYTPYPLPSIYNYTLTPRPITHHGPLTSTLNLELYLDLEITYRCATGVAF